jgi:haloalkane dehalogenase
VTATFEAIGRFMNETRLPTLLIYAEPGVLAPPQAIGWHTSHMRNLQTAYVGQGLHFIQEDQPDAIGRALADWLRRH